jgi:hypothetical protein
MVCPPDPRVGIAGVLLGAVSLWLPGQRGGTLGEHKAPGSMRGAWRAWALEACAGSAAVDARAAGSYGVLAAVAHRHDQRVWAAGRAHAAPPTDIAAGLGRCTTAVEARGVARQGITTEGAALSPEPIRLVVGAVPPPRWPFPVIKALPHGGWKAVAHERERLARSTPTGKRGRPSSNAPAARRRARNRPSLQQHSRDVCHERAWGITRRWKASERPRLRPLPRGRPPRRPRRENLEHRSALCDRRCRTPTALAPRKTWRQWGQRFPGMGDTCKKVGAPPREKALTLRDAKRLLATANAVERGKRRHRKRPKRVSRVRRTVC